MTQGERCHGSKYNSKLEAPESEGYELLQAAEYELLQAAFPTYILIQG